MLRAKGRWALALLIAPFVGALARGEGPDKAEVARASDAELYRRLALDVLGRLPRPEETRAFERGRAGGASVEATIDALLESGEAARYFADRWLATLLDGKLSETLPARTDLAAFRSWLERAHTNDVSYTQFVTELLSSSGEAKKTPAVNYVLSALEPGEPPWELAQRTTRVFLGIEIQCARCHDHPTEKITQRDFWGMAAFFGGAHAKARTTFEGFGIKLVEESATLKIPESETVVGPRFLDGQAPPEGTKPRELLAKCVVSHPRFLRAIAERELARLMGRSLDMADESERAVEATLVRELERGDFSLRKLDRAILTSRAYQGVASPRGREMHPLDPVQLLEALSATLDLDVFLKSYSDNYESDGAALPQSYRNASVFRLYLVQYAQGLLVPAGTPAERVTPGSVRLALKLMNGRELQGLVRAEWGRLKAILDAKKTGPERIEEIFYTVLGRAPSAGERSRYESFLEGSSDKKSAYEDVYWTLLNSNEFILNH